MWRRLPIEAHEWRLVVRAGAVLALIGWADVSVQNAAETLFLKRVGVSYLPLAFLVSALLLVATSSGFGRFVARRDRPRWVPLTLVGLALGLLPLWLAVATGAPGAIPLLVLASVQIKALSLLVLWVAMGDLVHARQAKRLFATLAAGLTVGTMVGSFVSLPVSRLIGIAGLIPFSSGVLGLAAITALGLGRMRVVRLERSLAESEGSEERRSPLGARIGALWAESPLFRQLSAITACSGVLAPMIYFQVSYAADVATVGADAEDRLMALYAQVRGALNAAILVTQLAITAGLFRRIGLPLSAALSPVAYLMAFTGLTLQLTLPVAIAALAVTRLGDLAIRDPALLVLSNFLPERIRGAASALLDGPVRRTGAALGNLGVLAALGLGGPVVVGLLALPVGLVWLGVAIRLWRSYPSLLLGASAAPTMLGEGVDLSEVLDDATLRGLAGRLRDSDPGRCAAAIELVCEGRRDLAVQLLAESARSAPAATRSMLIAALDRLLEANVTEPLPCEPAARAVEALLSEPERLDARDRADLVQAYGRLGGVDHPKDGPEVLARAMVDPSSAVRLAAAVALHRLGYPPSVAPALDPALERALREEDADARRTAREEIRALLLGDDADERWDERLARLTALLELPEERAAAAEALAEIANRHGVRAAPAGDAMLALRADPDPDVLDSVLRFAGRVGRVDAAPWIVEHLGSERGQTARAAQDGLLGLGPEAAGALLAEHSFGRRSTRDAILRVVRELEVDAATLRDLYERELDWIRHNLLTLYALRERGPGQPVPEILLQRLEERMDEGLHTALLFLTGIHDESRIAELDDLMRRTQGERQHAILMEALESVLSPAEQQQLLPLFDARSLEVRARAAALGLGSGEPSFEEAAASLAEDSDELTRTLAAAAFGSPGPAADGVVPAKRMGEDPGMLTPVEIALHLKAIPLFERLSTRQLMDLAALAHQERYPEGAVVFEEGDDGSSMYFVVEGEVEVRQGGVLRSLLGSQSFFGELAVFGGVTRSASIVTRTPARLIRLERREFLGLMEELPSIAIGICQSLTRKLREIETRT
jgi:CRP/FNR family cyclic AMP-dependent transcriptional regulator